MDITPQDNTTTQPISDDQELAKALAGVLPDEPDMPSVEAAPLEDTLAPTMQFEETPAVSLASISPTPTVAPDAPIVFGGVGSPTAPAPVSTLPTPTLAAPSPALSNLDSIKNDALNELRPLIDRVDLPAEEKFDTYLMLIRSTDDPSLIGPAHVIAQGIVDEKRRAEALLDVIKEIDYLSRKDQQPQL